MNDLTVPDNRNPRLIKATLGALLVFIALGAWQLISFSLVACGRFLPAAGLHRSCQQLDSRRQAVREA